MLAFFRFHLLCGPANHLTFLLFLLWLLFLTCEMPEAPVPFAHL